MPVIEKTVSVSGNQRPGGKRNRFLFMCGTPRSGTTFLAGVFGRHPLLAMGVERFKFHYSGRTALPELFDKERFFDLRAEDTSLREAIALPDIDAMRKKYDHCLLVGDKYPNIVRQFGWINERFDGPTFLFVLRHPVHVARSWAVRAANEKDRWPEKNDFPAGIRYWKDTLTHVVNARRDRIKVVLVDYDLIVNAPEKVVREYVERILGELDLPWSDEMCDALLKQRRLSGDVPLNEVEGRIMREILASAQWKAFMEHFPEGGHDLSEWSQLETA